MRRVPIICLVALLFAASLCHAQQASGSRPSGSSNPKVASSQVSPAEQQALALEQQARFPEAELAWAKVTKLEPRNARAYAHLGLIEAHLEHYPEAIAHYRKAQTLDAAIPQLNFNLGLALFKSGNFRDAAATFDSELHKHSTPQDAQRLAILTGMADYGAREYAAAIPYLKQATAADQRNLPLRLALAHCYIWTKQWDDAMRVYKEILTINSDSAEADMIAGEALGVAAAIAFSRCSRSGAS